MRKEAEREMYLSNLLEGGATPALAKTLAFNERRIGIIAENVANATTPNYKAKQLDVLGFQRALRRAFDQRGGDKSIPFNVENGREVRTNDHGMLEIMPSEQPTRNILSHDGTNQSLERQMADIAEKVMVHEMAGTLLRGNVNGLRKAIRGTVG